MDDELIKLAAGPSRLRSLQVKGNVGVTDASYERLLKRYPNLQIALPYGTSVSNAALRRYCASRPFWADKVDYYVQSRMANESAEAASEP